MGQFQALARAFGRGPPGGGGRESAPTTDGTAGRSPAGRSWAPPAGPRGGATAARGATAEAGAPPLVRRDRRDGSIAGGGTARRSGPAAAAGPGATATTGSTSPLPAVDDPGLAAVAGARAAVPGGAEKELAPAGRAGGKVPGGAVPVGSSGRRGTAASGDEPVGVATAAGPADGRPRRSASGGGGRKTIGGLADAARDAPPGATRLRRRAAASRSADGRGTFPPPRDAGVIGAPARTPLHSVTGGRSVSGRFGGPRTAGTPVGREPDHSDGATARLPRGRRRNHPAATPAPAPMPSPP